MAAIAGCCVIAAPLAYSQTNGIFADFTTSMGNFTCQLSYSNSPMAVANFMGLATGGRAWLDLPSGEMRHTPFYDGLTFHRVIAGFMNQGGSPNGHGTDDPGYAFVDQFSPLLNFNDPWVLAMANSGPNSNGSQFFVTVAPFASGNNIYVILGGVISGTNVVSAINRVATDPNNKPLTNVVIQHIAIRRVGLAAQAFDINAQGLPIVTNLVLKLDEGSGKASLTYSNRLFCDNRLYSSTDLSSWASNMLGVEIAAPFGNTVQVTSDAPQQFFRIAQIQYPSSTFAPKDLLGRTLTLIFTGVGTNTVVFDKAGGGTYNFPPVSPGTVASYSWTQDVYRGALWPIKYSGLNDMTLLLNFTNATGGSFSGTVYNASPFPVSGAFSLK